MPEGHVTTVRAHPGSGYDRFSSGRQAEQDLLSPVGPPANGYPSLKVQPGVPLEGGVEIQAGRTFGPRLPLVNDLHVRQHQGRDGFDAQLGAQFGGGAQLQGLGDLYEALEPLAGPTAAAVDGRPGEV